MKLFVSTLGLRRLESATPDAMLDSQINKFHLFWQRNALDGIADHICKSQTGHSFDSLVDARRLDAFTKANPAMLLLAPGTWITLAEQTCAMTKRLGRQVLQGE